MQRMVDVVLPVDTEAAEALRTPQQREAAGRYLSEMLRHGGKARMLAEAISALKAEAHANGLTDEIVDAELAAWRSEPSG